MVSGHVHPHRHDAEVRSTACSAPRYDETDAVIAGKEIVEDPPTAAASPIPAVLLDRGPGAARGRGGRRHRRARRGQRRRHHRRRRQGRREGEPRHQLRRRQRALQPAQAQDRRAGRRAPDQVVIDAGTAGKEHLAVGDDVVIATRGERRALPDHRHRLATATSTRSASAASPCGTSRPRSAARPRRAASTRLDRRQGRHVAGRARRRGRAPRAGRRSRSRTAPSRPRTTRRRSTRA